MRYEEMFTDFEKMRYEAAWDGFKLGNYGPMYNYIVKRLGVAQANFFETLTKRQKKCFCARLVYLNHPDKEKAEKGRIYFEKHRGDFLYDISYKEMKK